MIDYEKIQEAKKIFSDFSVPIKDGTIATGNGKKWIWKNNKWVEVKNDY